MDGNVRRVLARAMALRGKTKFLQRLRIQLQYDRLGFADIESARDQHDEAALLADAAGDAAGVVAGTQVEIGARRSDDRRSRILRNHQAAEG